MTLDVVIWCFSHKLQFMRSILTNILGPQRIIGSFQSCILRKYSLQFHIRTLPRFLGKNLITAHLSKTLIFSCSLCTLVWAPFLVLDSTKSFCIGCSLCLDFFLPDLYMAGLVSRLRLRLVAPDLPFSSYLQRLLWLFSVMSSCLFPW